MMNDIRLSRRAVVAGMLATPALRLPARADTPRGTLVIGHLAELQTLDPAQAVTISDDRILGNVYDGLVHYKDGSLEIEPGLAESCTVSPDTKAYTFKLRKGVKFHDGSDFSAERVKFNFDRVTDKNHPYYNTGPFPFVFTLGPIEKTEVLDPFTVAVHLKEPYSPFRAMQGAPSALLA